MIDGGLSLSAVYYWSERRRLKVWLLKGVQGFK